MDDEGLVGEAVDPGGSAGLCLEVSEGEWETGGVWTGPREDDPPVPATSLGVRRAKPQLTITVPSSENLSHMQVSLASPPPLLHSSVESRFSVCPFFVFFFIFSVSYRHFSLF